MLTMCFNGKSGKVTVELDSACRMSKICKKVQMCRFRQLGHQIDGQVRKYSVNYIISFKDEAEFIA